MTRLGRGALKGTCMTRLGRGALKGTYVRSLCPLSRGRRLLKTIKMTDEKLIRELHKTIRDIATDISSSRSDDEQVKQLAYLIEKLASGSSIIPVEQGFPQNPEPYSLYDIKDSQSVLKGNGIYSVNENGEFVYRSNKNGLQAIKMPDNTQLDTIDDGTYHFQGVNIRSIMFGNENMYDDFVQKEGLQYAFYQSYQLISKTIDHGDNQHFYKEQIVTGLASNSDSFRYQRIVLLDGNGQPSISLPWKTLTTKPPKLPVITYSNNITMNLGEWINGVKFIYNGSQGSLKIRLRNLKHFSSTLFSINQPIEILANGQTLTFTNGTVIHPGQVGFLMRKGNGNFYLVIK